MRMFRSRALLLGLLTGIASGPPEAWACACCSEYGERAESSLVLTPSSDELHRLSAVRFGSDAELVVGPQDPKDVGVATTSSKLKVQVEREPARWIFAFRDEEGRSGSLVLDLANPVLWRLSVDPRRKARPADGDTGPALYHEWKVTAPAAGTGIFAAPGMPGRSTPGKDTGHKISLILQGNGNHCFEFTHWVLSVSGPAIGYTIAGELQ